MTNRTTTARHAAHGMLAGLVLLCLAGCKEEKKAAPTPAAANPAIERVRDAAEQNIQASAAAPSKIRFRGVQVYRQSAPDRIAVCGQVNPFADDPNIFVPFVSVVATQQKGQWTEYQFEQRIGSTTADASRVYAAIVTYCFENGGPAQALGRSVVATPPMPDTIAEPSPSAAAPPRTAAAAPPAKPAAPPAATLATEASGSVTVRQSANVRSDPHGPSVRTVPQGTSLRVFGQAPGGWYQVGETQPIGWVHESMLDRR